MPLADIGLSLLWVVGALVVGFVAFFAIITLAVFRAVADVFGLLQPRPRPVSATGAGLSGQLRCSDPKCCHGNLAGARYCARCGRVLLPGRARGSP